MLGKFEGGKRRGQQGWDGWMGSPTQWTWVWVNSRSWWWTERPWVMDSGLPFPSPMHESEKWKVKSESEVAQSCLTLWDPMDCSTPGFPVFHHLLELAQTHVHWVCDTIQPSCPLSSPSPPAFSLSQHQGLFSWVISSHQEAKVAELQLQHQSFQWIFRVDFL